MAPFAFRSRASAFIVVVVPASLPMLLSAFQTPVNRLPPKQPIPWQHTPTILPHNRPVQTEARSSPSRTTALHATPPPLPDTSDPFLLLGLDPANPTADRKEIKRAYKRRALVYHPDVVVTPESTPEEKRRASDDFAKINAAYEMLSGKGSGGVGVGAGAGAGAGDGAGGASAGGYQPPHRRSGAYSSTTSSGSRGAAGSTDWRDYMPRYEEEDAKYDTGGDSFEKIFNDVLNGVAAGAVGAAAGAGGGGGGILKDLIDFLEGNVDGFASGYEDDDSLASLLTFGSLEDVADEVDDTQLLVSQLETKLDTMDKETVMIQEEVRVTMKYIEKIELEERLAEIEARKGVVGNYLKKARKRLVKLQGRYKELIVGGRADGRAGTGGYYSDGGYGSSSSSSSYSGSGGSSYQSDAYGAAGRSSGTYSGGTTPASGRVPSPSPSSSYSSSAPPSASSTASSSTRTGAVGEDEPQSFSRREGFGSFGRRGGRGTGRGRRRASGGAEAGRASSSSSSSQSPSSAAGDPGRSGTTGSSSRTAAGDPGSGRTTSSDSSNGRRASYSSSPRPPPSSGSASSSSTSSSSSIQGREEWTPPVPPHRRTSPDRQADDDKKRLREIQVDDEFEKLKKELGL